MIVLLERSVALEIGTRATACPGNIIDEFSVRIELFSVLKWHGNAPDGVQCTHTYTITYLHAKYNFQCDIELQMPTPTTTRLRSLL